MRALRHLDPHPVSHQQRERLWAGVRRRSKTPRSIPTTLTLAAACVGLAFCAGRAVWPTPLYRTEDLDLQRYVALARPGIELTVPRPLRPVVSPRTSPQPSVPQDELPASAVQAHAGVPLLHDVEGDRNAGYLEATPPSIDELFARADAARAERPRDAVAALERIVHEHPRDPRAALAAFTAARIGLDRLADRQAAIRLLERALALGLPATLQEDARALLRVARSTARP